MFDKSWEAVSGLWQAPPAPVAAALQLLVEEPETEDAVTPLLKEGDVAVVFAQPEHLTRDRGPREYFHSVLYMREHLEGKQADL
jgi:hypothetical protein